MFLPIFQKVPQVDILPAQVFIKQKTQKFNIFDSGDVFFSYFN